MTESKDPLNRLRDIVLYFVKDFEMVQSVLR